MFTTYEKKSSNGANRKYYQITKKGREFLKNNLEEWYDFLKQTEFILGGKKDE